MFTSFQIALKLNVNWAIYVKCFNPLDSHSATPHAKLTVVDVVMMTAVNNKWHALTLINHALL